MTNRKKRLEKGIESLQEQIDIHEEKKKVAEESGNLELVDYYTKEIKATRGSADAERRNKTKKRRDSR